MSVTSGVVSRIEVTSYSHGATALLGMQIDAAINAGNSGGPAFNAKGLISLAAGRTPLRCCCICLPSCALPYYYRE